MQHPLTPLFESQSIAIFGASEREGSVGAQVVENLLAGGYSGQLHFINPRHSALKGRPCFDKLARLRERVDLAVVATPASTVLDIVADCAAAGVRAMVVLTAGFSEAGNQGARLQERLTEAALRAGIQLLGPNLSEQSKHFRFMQGLA